MKRLLRLWAALLGRVERLVLDVLITLLVALLGRQLRKRFREPRGP